MEPAEEPIRAMRETTRFLFRVNRQVHKDEITDERRSLETTRITPNTLADIANRLKSKSAVSLSELNILKNSLIDDTKNIELVLSTDGALRGLVREISGTDIKRQAAAAGCLCNLALGDSKACLAISKAAGPYLVAGLGSLSEELAVPCAWTLGNLSGSGRCACAALVSGGAVSALARLLRRGGGGGGGADAAADALSHFAYQLKDDLSVGHLNDILEAYNSIKLTPTSCHLLFLLTCHRQLTHFPEHLLLKVLEAVAVSIQKQLTACTEADDYELAHLLRTLANVCISREYSDIVLYSFREKELLANMTRIVFTAKAVVRESLMWLLGNLNNSCGDGVFSHLAFC